MTLGEGTQGRGERRWERGSGEGVEGGQEGVQKRGEKGICSIYSIYLHIPSYTFIYLYIR